MSFEELENLATAYVMGELNEEQRSDFERRMIDDPELVNLVDSLEVSLNLAMLSEVELVEPGEGLKARLLDAVPEPQGEQALAKEETADEKISPFPLLPVAVGLVGWAAAACLAFLFLNQGSNLETIREEAQMVEAEVRQLESEMESLAVTATSLETEKQVLENSLESAQANAELLQQRLDSLTTQLAEVENQRQNLEELVTNLRQQSVLDKVQIAALSSEVDELRYGFAVWDTENDRGIAKVFNLQSLDIPNQDYQFWVISPEQESPVPAGVFQVDSAGGAEYQFSSSIPVDVVNAFAISLEPKGGSPSPTGPIVLSGAL